MGNVAGAQARYVIITPARNEASSLERTFTAIASQSSLPAQWVIVDDGSIDGTGDAADGFAARHGWIRVIHRDRGDGRGFASKVRAVSLAYEAVSDLAFEFVAIVDADVSFEPDHFEYMLHSVASSPRVGVFGTPFIEAGVQYHRQWFTDPRHVPGQCQVFRRECYEDVGGLLPIPEGGEDTIALVMARMRGWETRLLTGRCFVHHREMGTAAGGVIQARLRDGVRDHVVGNHPAWEVLKVLARVRRRPFLLGSILMLCGYSFAACSRRNCVVPREVVAHLRHEQLSRILHARRWGRSKAR